MILRPCLQLEEKALTVAEDFFETCGREAIRKVLPTYADRIAYGLVGEGSECYGFDDIISTDHDYGPSFCMWLTHEDYQKVGMQAQAVYKSLPANFKGHKPRVCREQAGARVGALDMDAFYARFIGRPTAPTELIDWMRVPENYFAVACNGKVFEDKLGAFTAVREKLLAFYPEDVRKKKLAARVCKMAHSGQCNYARLMRRGDIVASFNAVSEFIENTVAAIYLLNRRYCPYYKWRFRGLLGLDILRDCADLLEQLAATPSTLAAWDDDAIVLDFTAINMQDERVRLMEEISARVGAELRRQGLTDCTGSYLEAYAFQIQDSIEDERIRAMHILQG